MTFAQTMDFEAFTMEIDEGRAALLRLPGTVLDIEAFSFPACCFVVHRVEFAEQVRRVGGRFIIVGEVEFRLECPIGLAHLEAFSSNPIHGFSGRPKVRQCREFCDFSHFQDFHFITRKD